MYQELLYTTPLTNTQHGKQEGRIGLVHVTCQTDTAQSHVWF